MSRMQLQGLESRVEGSHIRLYKAKEGRNEGMQEAS
jgi:hypothetical protein